MPLNSFFVRAFTTEGHPLPDEYWHITDHYENIKVKVASLDPKVGDCDKLKDYLPERVCNIPLHARGEYTPRANPSETSLRTVLKKGPDGWIPKLEVSMLYDGPDVPNPNLQVPHGDIDTAEIAGLRRQLEMIPQLEYLKKTLWHENDTHAHLPRLRQRNLEIQSGKGWEFSNVLPGNCDGTYDAICGRLPSSDCLLYGHMDSKGGLIGNESSGWLVFIIPQVVNGIIILKIESNHSSDENTVTKSWADENNGENIRFLEESTTLPADFIFDYAIDGVVSSLNLFDFKSKLSYPQSNIELFTVLDDADFEGPKDVEIAIQMRNCGRDCTFSVTHIYWS